MLGNSMRLSFFLDQRLRHAVLEEKAGAQRASLTTEAQFKPSTRASSLHILLAKKYHMANSTVKRWGSTLRPLSGQSHMTSLSINEVEGENEYLLNSNLIHHKAQTLHKRATIENILCQCGTYRYHGILLSHKKNEILPLVTTWMDLEDILPSEISHIEKDPYCMISLLWEPTKQNKQI